MHPGWRIEEGKNAVTVRRTIISEFSIASERGRCKSFGRRVSVGQTFLCVPTLGPGSMATALGLLSVGTDKNVCPTELTPFARHRSLNAGSVSIDGGKEINAKAHQRRHSRGAGGMVLRGLGGDRLSRAAPARLPRSGVPRAVFRHHRDQLLLLPSSAAGELQAMARARGGASAFSVHPV